VQTRHYASAPAPAPAPCLILPDIVATKRLQFGSQPGAHNWPGQKHLFGFASFTWQQQAIALLSNPIKDHWRQQQQRERKEKERERERERVRTPNEM